MSHPKAIRLAFAAVAIAFFATPIAARVVVAPEQFENRRFADAPRPSQGWEAFAQTSRYLIDRMPLRAQAVRANTSIWQDVFGADPRYVTQRAESEGRALPFAGIADLPEDLAQRKARNALSSPATAIRGRKGWLFFDGEIRIACEPDASNATVLDRWARLVRVVRERGQNAAMFVVPHKSSVYPEYIPDSNPDKACSLAAKDRRWRFIAERGPAQAVFELRSELVDLKPRLGDELFELTGMHWTTLGALTLVGAALDELGDGIQIKPSEVKRDGPISYTGDLGVASGSDETEKHYEYYIARDPHARRVPGRTVLVCDSFAYHQMHVLEPYFEHIEDISLYESAPELVKAIRQADNVIFEAVESNYASYASSSDSLVERTIATLLKAPPARKP